MNHKPLFLRLLTFEHENYDNLIASAVCIIDA